MGSDVGRVGGMSTTAGKEGWQQQERSEECERSGRYAIDPRLLPGDRRAHSALDSQPANTQQPPAGVFGTRPTADDEVLAIDDELDSLTLPTPPVRSLPPPVPNPTERAELVIEDLSLVPGNPFAGSSLVPASRRSEFPWRAVLAVSAIGLTIIGGLAVASYAVGTRSAGVATPPAKVEKAVPLRRADRVPVPAVSAPVAQNVADEPTQSEAVASAAREIAEADGVGAAEVAAPKVPDESVTKPIGPTAPVSASSPALEGDPATAAPPGRSVPAPARPQRAAGTAAEARVPGPSPAAASLTPAVAPSEAAAAAEMAPTETVVEGLPEQPSRDQIIATFEGLRPALTECAVGQSGLLQVKATITGAGRVGYALIGGDFQGPTGSCMARVVRKASFPQFSGDKLSLTYPMSL